MKKLLLMGSKKGWIILTVMLLVFITLASMLLLFLRPLTSESEKKETVIYYVNDAGDHSYESVKDRVNSMNENYGQQVKSAFSGEDSTVEKMMKQRMVHTTIKNILMYALIILVILLILVKGFNLNLFKKKPVKEKPKATAETQQVEKPVSSIQKGNGEVSEPKEKDTETTDECENGEKCEQSKDMTADEEQVIEDCKLP